eukprot:986449-Prorocentrum_minimum.AAC.3
MPGSASPLAAPKTPISGPNNISTKSFTTARGRTASVVKGRDLDDEDDDEFDMDLDDDDLFDEMDDLDDDFGDD